MTEKITVLLEEEYGYRYWTWHTDMTEKELINWWTNLETVDPFFFNPGRTLPGKLIESDMRLPPKTNWRGHIHEDSDSSLSDGTTGYFHKGRQDPSKVVSDDK